MRGITGGYLHGSQTLAAAMLMLVGAGACGIARAADPDSVIRGIVGVEVTAPKLLPDETAVGIALGTVSGGLTGQGALFYKEYVGADGLFAVRVSTLEAALRQAATPATGSTHIQPSNTRISRLGTVGFPLDDPESTLDGRIRARDSGNTLILFYVDRPCHVSGHLPLGDNPQKPLGSFELDVPHAGLNWVDWADDPKRITLTIISMPAEVDYVISE